LGLKLSGIRPVLLFRVLSQVLTSVDEPVSPVAAAAGDTRFAALVEEHAPMVFRTLLRLLGMREGLDDLAQDCFLRLYRALPAFRGQAMISTYLYRIVVNVAQDELRRTGATGCGIRRAMRRSCCWSGSLPTGWSERWSN
jgi:hypothetical protein